MKSITPILLSLLITPPAIANDKHEIWIPRLADIQSVKDDLSSLDCLAINAYHEARGESDVDNEAIMGVVLTRVQDSRYPDTICDVIFQNKQFSWTSDSKSDAVQDEYLTNKRYVELYKLTEKVLQNHSKYQSLTDYATHYHADWANPYWAPTLQLTKTYDHVFYKWN